MSDEESKDPNRWDMPIRVAILAVLAVGIWVYFYHYKAPKTADTTAETAPAPDVPPVVRAVEAPGATPVKWKADNDAATTMTGDVQVSAGALVLKKQSYPLQATHTLTHSELLAAGNFFLTSAPLGSVATLYQVDIPAKVKLLNGDSMCGAEPASWVLALTTADTVEHTETLYLGFFAGATPPGLTVTTLPSAAGSCGKFNYTRKVG